MAITVAGICVAIVLHAVVAVDQSQVIETVETPIELDETDASDFCSLLDPTIQNFFVKAWNGDNLSPLIDGCASTMYGSLDLWLGNFQNGVCGDKRTEGFHYRFQCMGMWNALSSRENYTHSFAALYDREAVKTGREPYRCASYEHLKEGLYIIISSGPDCIKSRRSTFFNHESTVSDDGTSINGSLVLLISKNKLTNNEQPYQKPPIEKEETTPTTEHHSVRRWILQDYGKRNPHHSSRSKRQTDDECRFPDWAQGQWLDLRVDGSTVRYAHTVREDDDDDERETDGVDGDAETLGRGRIRRSVSDTFADRGAAMNVRDKTQTNSGNRHTENVKNDSIERDVKTVDDESSAQRKQRSVKDLLKLYGYELGDSEASTKYDGEKTLPDIDENASLDTFEGFDNHLLQINQQVRNPKGSAPPVEFPSDDFAIKNNLKMKLVLTNTVESDQVELHRSRRSIENSTTTPRPERNFIDTLQDMWRHQLRQKRGINNGYVVPRYFDEDRYKHIYAVPGLSPFTIFLYNEGNKELGIWEGIKSFFGFNDKPSGPTPPPSPPPTPPNTPPRTQSNVKNDGNVERQKRDTDFTDIGTVMGRKKRSLTSSDTAPNSESLKNKELGKQIAEMENNKDQLGTTEKTNHIKEHLDEDNKEIKTKRDALDLIIEFLHLGHIPYIPFPPIPTYGFRKTRDTRDNQGKYFDEEAILERIRFLETENYNRLLKWWKELQKKESNIQHRFKPEHKQGEYDEFPEGIPIPHPTEFLHLARNNGVPYKVALLKWRALERVHRFWKATVDFTKNPTKNPPSVVIGDFDHTFRDITYDFDPFYPEGTSDDPTAYLVQTSSDGKRYPSRQSRRETWEQKHEKSITLATNVVKVFKQLNKSNVSDSYNTDRQKRSTTQERAETSKFSWRCIISVEDNDKKPNTQTSARFLTWGGRIIENRDMTAHNGLREEKKLSGINDEMMYGCLWFVSRGPKTVEYTVIGTGMPKHGQNLKSFAQDLCNSDKTNSRDEDVRYRKNLRPRRQWWVTEARTDDTGRVPVACPVPPGTVFYGVVPAPPIAATITTSGSTNGAPSTQMCAKLISSAVDCTNGPFDKMKYTVSECIDSTVPQMVTPTQGVETVFEAAAVARGHHNQSPNQRRNKRDKPIRTVNDTQAAYNGTPTPSSTTSTVTNTTPSPLPSPFVTVARSPSISSFPTTTLSPPSSSSSTSSYASTTTFSPIETSGSTTVSSGSTVDHHYRSIANNPTPDTTTPTFANSSNSSNGGQTSDFATTVPTITTTTTVGTTASTSALPANWQQRQTTVDRRSRPSSSSTVPPSHYHSGTSANDYYYRQQQQQQWQQQQPNNHNNDDYYSRQNGGRQQQYSPTPTHGAGTDYYYRQQQQQQHWSQQQHQWAPQQHPADYNAHYDNGYQHQTTSTTNSGRRTDDYYYRQPQQNYAYQRGGNQPQMTTPTSHGWQNASLSSNGGWNVHGDRPLFVSSGGTNDNVRDAPLLWNSTTGGGNDNGGWTTTAQQYWWYRQQQRQQQNGRTAGGILSLPPVPLPPLHHDQTVSTSVQQPSPPQAPQPPPAQQPLRQPKNPNHYYMPTPSAAVTTGSPPNRVRPKSESRYYEEREYQCLGQWTETQRQPNTKSSDKPVTFTYTYVKRVDPAGVGGTEYECFVGTTIPNDDGQSSSTTTTILLTEAGTGTRCSRLADPYRSGMKLVGTKTGQGSCGGQQGQTSASGGSWYPLKPQQIPSSAENPGGKWYAAQPVPVQNPTSGTSPIITAKPPWKPLGNGDSPTSRQQLQNGGRNHGQQTRRPPAATTPQENGGVPNAKPATALMYYILALVFVGRFCI